MDRTNDIKIFLNERLDGNFDMLNHKSLNKHFVGFSKYYGTNVFIKIFMPAQEKKFLTEKTILFKNKQRYIDSFEFLGMSFLILKDYDFQDIEPEWLDSKENLINLARIIKNFHFQNFRMTKLNRSDESGIVQKIEKIILEINDSPYINEVNRIWKKLKEIDYNVNLEYNNNKFQTLIHGDFSMRNIKLLEGRPYLIDFERSKLDFYFLDFIKFFYIDLNNDEKKFQIFLSEYYKETKFIYISEVLIYFLVFYTALGIFKYNLNIEDINFLKKGLYMMNDVDKYIKNQSST